jgi:signal transduction histidine kinase
VTRPTLRALIARRIGVVFTVSVVLFTLVVGFVVHWQVHQQTDAMLLQIATSESEGVLGSFEAGIHVHNASIHLPSLNSPVVEMVSVTYGIDRHVLAATSNFKAHELPEVWTYGLSKAGDTRIFNDDHSGREALRVAAFAAKTPNGELLIFATAVPHVMIDSAVRRTILLIALLAAAMLIAVLVASNLVARQIARDLQELSGTCSDLRDAPDQLEAWLSAFDASSHSTAETAALARTIHDLVSRLQRLVDVQNRFVAEAAHELRTPLTALQGELEIALRRDRDAKDYREFIENARVDAARLASLAEHLLEAARSRVEELQPEEILLKDALHDAVGRNARALQSANIDVVFQTDHSKVCADAIATARVLDNLIANAVRHSGASRLELICNNGQVVIEDNGRGIPDEVRQNLFVPFAQRKGDGHGLGLFIAARLMEKQHGKLELAQGKGTRWICTFKNANRVIAPVESDA